MKILYHHRTQGRGGEGVHVREIIKALEALGNEVVTLSPPGVNPFISEVTHKEERSAIRRFLGFISRHSPQILFELFEIMYNFWAEKKIKKILEKEKIDFIYERYAFFCWAGVKLARKFNTPIILEVNEVSGIKRTRKQVLVDLAKRIEKKIFRKADAIITVSSFLKQRIQEIGVESQKIHIISNAINPEEFRLSGDREGVRKKFNLNGNVVIGFVGMFCEWDNLGFLIDAFSDLADGKMRIKLMLIGEGSERKKIEEKAIKSGLGNDIIFTGLVNRKEISDFIGASDICVIPNSNPFGSPIILFEYMAMAKPVVAPKLMPIKDIVEDGKDGVLFELGDRKSFAKALDMLLMDSDKRRMLGEEAKKKVLEKHTWLKNAERVLSIYREKLWIG